MIKQFLTSNHIAAPEKVLKNNLWFPVYSLIEINDIATLNSLDIFIHETPEGEAPLGYTDWEFNETTKKYTRQRVGTEEEIQQKLEQNELIRWRNQTAVPKIYCKIALARAGLLESIYQIISLLTLEEQLYFNEHPDWKRSHPLVIKVAIEQMELTEVQLDDLFRLSETIQIEDLNSSSSI